MATMLSALLLLGVVGACVVLGFLSEENIESMRDAVIEAKRWIRIRLDSLGQRPDLDAGSDVEAGMGVSEEIWPMDGQHLLPLPAARPSLGGPVRRSVYRGQAGGVAPTLAITSLQSVQSDYASLNDSILQSQPRRDIYLPRPIALQTARATSATASASVPKPIKKRGTSFDADRSAGVSFRVRGAELEHGSGSVNNQGGFGRANQPPLRDAPNRPLLLHVERGQGSDVPSSVVAAFGGTASASPSSSSCVRQGPARARAKSHRRSSSSNMVNMASAITPMLPAHRRSATRYGDSARPGRSSPRHLPPVPAFDTLDAARNADGHLGDVNGRDTVEGRFPHPSRASPDNITDCERKSPQPGSDSYGGSFREPELPETESLNVEASMTARWRGSRHSPIDVPNVNQGWARDTMEESKQIMPSFFGTPSLEYPHHYHNREHLVSPRGASGDSLVGSDGNAPEGAWSLEAHLNLGAGVGVRRRLSPRAEGCSLQRGAGAGGGSGDRGGWAPVSPPKQDGLQFVDGESEDEDTFQEMDDRLRPRMMPFSDEATERSQSIFDEPPPEDGERRLADASPMSFAQVLADASTPKAGAAGLRGNGFGRDPTATSNHIGLKCSSPLYDRETNMLGGPRVPSYRGRKGRGRSPRPSASPKVAAEKHAREGRDFTSTEALAAGSLDLAFEELELTNLIGGGGFGQVHQGLWRGTPVAVKVLIAGAQRDLDDEIAADFRAEVLMLAALRHPNVCLFMAACMTPPNRAIVTELVSRGSLWEALRNEHLPSVTFGVDAFECSTPRPRGGIQHPVTRFKTPAGCWPWAAIMKVAMGTACGMNYLHRREPFPILHRDLKSANLLLDESFNVKICDFGLARLKAYTNSMTGNCGTVQWMAPEVLASKKYTETADVYSFAVVCWELLSRACPYEGLNQIQVAVKVLNNGLRPDIPQWCPPEFKALIENSWQQEAGERPSFGEILRELRSVPDPLLSVV